MDFLKSQIERFREDVSLAKVKSLYFLEICWKYGGFLRHHTFVLCRCLVLFYLLFFIVSENFCLSSLSLVVQEVEEGCCH